MTTCIDLKNLEDFTKKVKEQTDLDKHFGILLGIALGKEKGLEIGTGWGTSTLALSAGLSLSQGVLFTCDPVNRLTIKLPSNVIFYNMTSQQLASSWKETIDFLFIDGDHSYEGVKFDYSTFSKWVKLGGIIAIHDIAHPAFPGVSEFWQELKSLQNSVEMLEFPGLGILQIKQ